MLIAIIGMTSAVAFPIYKGYKLKSERIKLENYPDNIDQKIKELEKLKRDLENERK